MGRFVIGMIFKLDSEPDGAHVRLLYTVNANTGLDLHIVAASSLLRFYLWNGTTSALVQYDISDENLHAIFFEVTETTSTIVVDNVAGAPVAHNFVPSGLSFADSTQIAPNGTLENFKIWTETEFDKYDRDKEYNDWLSKRLLGTVDLSYDGEMMTDLETGDRYLVGGV